MKPPAAINGPVPELSVILCTHNRRDVLFSKCLPSVFAQDLASELFEVIVIDDGSTDGTGAALRKLDAPCVLRVHEQANKGLSRARNTGIAAARGKVLLFLDDDFVLRPDVFRLHLDAHGGGEELVAHGAIYLSEGSRPSLLTNANREWYKRYNSQLAEHGGAIWPEGIFLLSNSSMPRPVLLACGGLDEQLHAMDDFELGLRLWKRGVGFRYLPDAVGFELSVKSWRSFLFRDGEAFGRTAVILSRKYPELRVSLPLLAGMGQTPWMRRVMRRVAIQCLISPAYLLMPPIWLCEKLCRFPVAQRGGLRLLEIGRRLTELRAARRQTGAWKAFEREFAVRLPVLLYHHVGPKRPGTYRSLTVSPKKFERQIRWLAQQGYQGIRAIDWLRWRAGGRELPDKPVIITFDDGYEDLAEHAFPVLQRYGFSAAVFVVTGHLGGSNAWDEADGCGTLPLLSAKQIADWAAKGIEFGSHTRTHPDLRKLPAQELEAEIAGSKSELEHVLGGSVKAFAYPYGFLTEVAVPSVRQSYDLAFGIDPITSGINCLQTDPHRMRRTMVQPDDTVADLACRVAIGSSPIARLRARLRLRSRLKRVVHYRNAQE